MLFSVSTGKDLEYWQRGGGSQRKTRAAKSAQVPFGSDCNSTQCSLVAALHPLLCVPAPKDSIPVYPALSRNYMGFWLSAEEPQATILPLWVTLELLGKKIHFTSEIGDK